MGRERNTKNKSLPSPAFPLFRFPLAHTPRSPPSPALTARFRGRLAPLLRHPTAAAVVDELYARAAPAARDLMAAEFYSREAVLLPASGAGAGVPASLAAALAGADAARRRATLARLAATLTPVVEKGMLDAVLVHR